MYDTATIILWGFRWFNIIVIFVVAAYFFRTKIIHIIKKQIAEKRNFFQSLYEKLEKAARKNTAINKSIEVQQKDSTQLLKKAEQWTRAVTIAQREYEEVYSQRLKTMSAYREEQLENFVMQEMRKSIIPQAVKDASAELKKKFAKPEAQKQYMNGIISFMKKN
ncbi:MAG TPA: hypothetical protein QGF02_02500 [Candidatus Babeliales bacterium]|nr:hypothetical protein [Candidatus Babeliales bacterium]